MRLFRDPTIVPGGAAPEAMVCHAIYQAGREGKKIGAIDRVAFEAFGSSLLDIPNPNPNPII